MEQAVNSGRIPNDFYQTMGERIRRAREGAGLSQQELAKKIGYSSSATISHFESGDRKISILDLQRIAQTLGIPTDYFLQQDTDSLQGSANTEVVKSFHMRAKEIRPQARETVMAFLSFAQKHSEALKQSIPSGIEQLGPAKAANKILGIVQITNPPISPHNVAISLGVPIVEWDFPDEISGIFVSYQNRFCIGVNELHPPVRQRFSVAHELGHLVFDRDEALFVDFEGAAITADLQERQNSKAERNANQFAADLLMPKSLLQKDVSKYGLDVTFLAKRYQVSQQALWFRLLNLGLVTDAL